MHHHPTASRKLRLLRHRLLSTDRSTALYGPARDFHIITRHVSISHTQHLQLEEGTGSRTVESGDDGKKDGGRRDAKQMYYQPTDTIPQNERSDLYSHHLNSPCSYANHSGPDTCTTWLCDTSSSQFPVSCQQGIQRRAPPSC